MKPFARENFDRAIGFTTGDVMIDWSPRRGYPSQTRDRSKDVWKRILTETERRRVYVERTHRMVFEGIPPNRRLRRIVQTSEPRHYPPQLGLLDGLGPLAHR